MATGPLGLNRPFVEESEQSQVIIYEFDDRYTKRDLREVAQVMIGKFENEGIGVSDTNVDNGTNNLISIELLTTNSSIQEIQDMRNIGLERQGYENMVVSTVPPDQIRRMRG